MQFKYLINFPWQLVAERRYLQTHRVLLGSPGPLVPFQGISLSSMQSRAHVVLSLQ